MQYCPTCRAAYRSALSYCPRDGSPLSMGPDPLVGQVLAGRYKVLNRIGKGGMGQVYLAEHTEIGKQFAVKVLFGDLASNDKMLARFKREAKAASLLKHIHIISVTDFGSTEQGLAFISMELLSGRSLAQVIEKEGPLSVNRTAHIGKQIASALAHAHDKGILHRDLKPENVMIEDREEGSDFITVLDFGLARLLQSKNTVPEETLTAIGTVQGTPEFMSPEQAQGLPLGPPSDLYALGLLLYCMLSQELPFPLPPKRAEMLALHAFEPPRPLSKLVRVPRALESVVMRLLEKDPSKRYVSGRDVVFALDDAIAAADKERRSSSASDTWDEDIDGTLSDETALTLSEANQPEGDGAQTIRMFMGAPSVLDLEQAASDEMPPHDSDPGYVVIASNSGPVATVSPKEDLPEQTQKTEAKPVHIPPKPRPPEEKAPSIAPLNSAPINRVEETLKHPALADEIMSALKIGVPPEALGATYKLPAISNPAKPPATQSKIAWFLAGLFVVLAIFLAILFFGK